MPALANPRHERFAQERAKGETADAAYVTAGFKANRSNAARLNAIELIAARVAEITERAAVRTELTVASATEILLRLATKGEKLGDAAGISAARASVMDACKLNGLVVDKTESLVDQVQRVISDQPLTEEEWAEEHGADASKADGRVHLWA
jgi:hypothetical protein